MYVNGNPINLIDPSGNVPCYMLPPEDQVNCVAVPASPDWWIKESQVYIAGLGYFDAGHVRRGWTNGGWFINQIELALERSYQYNLSGLGLPITIPLARAKSDERYWVDYAVSSNIKEEQKYGIAYGMYMDFERGYEQYQDSLPLEWISGFAPADLPSDHLGFWAAMSGYEFDELPTLLQCLGTLKVLPLQLPGGFIVDSNGIPENHEFLPMIGEVVDLGGSTTFRQRNIAWPAFLEIQPIPSGPNTWQVLNRSFP